MFGLFLCIGHTGGDSVTRPKNVWTCLTERRLWPIIRELRKTSKKTQACRTIFSSVLLGDEDVNHHGLQPENMAYWNRHLHMDSLQPCWKRLYQVLLTNSCTAKLEGIDSWIHVSHLKWLPHLHLIALIGHPSLRKSQIKVIQSWHPLRQVADNIWGRRLFPRSGIRPARSIPAINNPYVYFIVAVIIIFLGMLTILILLCQASHLLYVIYCIFWSPHIISLWLCSTSWFLLF